MEVYILDSLLRRTEVVDRFDSFIWTERERDIGDFELVINSTSVGRRLFKLGTCIATNESFRVMVVEDVEKDQDAEGRNLLRVTGRSLEKIMEDRVLKPGGTAGTDLPDLFYPGKPADIARRMFRESCIDGLYHPEDVLPFIVDQSVPGTPLLFPKGNIPEPLAEISIAYDVESLYKAIKDLCDAHGMGFRLCRNFDTSQLYFDIYMGNDLTSEQTLLPPVIFSDNLDNLQNIKEVQSIVGQKNVVYVMSKLMTVVVYAAGVDPNVAGFARQAMFLKEDPDEKLSLLEHELELRRLGNQALAGARGISAFDGEIPQTGSYKYGVDYNLGDVVEMRSDEGEIYFMRVTEQIFISDSEGDRSYPTLMQEDFVMPGTWETWDYNQKWQEATMTWLEAGSI